MYTPSNHSLIDQSRPDFILHPGNQQNKQGSILFSRLKTAPSPGHEKITNLTEVETFHNECERFTQSVQNIYEALSRSDSASGNDSLRPVLSNLTAHIVAFEQLLANQHANTTYFPANRRKRFAEAVHAVLDRELDNAELTVLDLAHELCMSQSTLYRLFRDFFGCKPNDLIRNYRLTRALGFLQKNEARVKEIAYQCGFNNLSYFSKCFKAKFGELPSQVIKMKVTLQGSVLNRSAPDH